jgi:hypothetical protein
MQHPSTKSFSGTVAHLVLLTEMRDYSPGICAGGRNRIVIGDKPGSLSPKARDRIGTRVRQLTSEGVSDPLPPSLARLMEELEQQDGEALD